MFEDIKEIFRTKLRKEYESLPIDFATLIRVEIGLLLLEKLNLHEQTVLNMWAINQGIRTPLMDGVYQNKTYSHWVANFRMLTRRQTGLHNWEEDLKQYAGLPVKDRLFELDPAVSLVSQVIRRTNNALHRLAAYEEVLNGNLPVAKHGLSPAHSGEVTFRVIDQQFSTNLSDDLIKIAKDHAGFNHFQERRSVKPITFTYEEFFAFASEMDARELELGFPDAKLSRWQDRVKKINIRFVEGKKLSKSNSRPLIIDGLLHIPGTVNSGKSTLMTIMAYAFAKMNLGDDKPDRRITLIVGDVVETLRLSDYLNRLICKWDDAPVAIPIVGHTQRAKHLKQFYRLASTDVKERNWSYRFLNPVCPLYGTINPEQYHPVLNTPGLEPCNYLSQYKERKGSNGSTITTSTRCFCPLFSICPSQQLFLDLKDAPIWITTPGALGSARVPPQIDDRSLRLWELVYEQSDLVIFDEVDAVQLWFDQVFSPEILLENGRGGGVLHETNRKVAQVTASEFRSNKSKHRWFQDQNTSVTAGQHILYLAENYGSLEKWLSGQSFTALRLFYKLSDDLSGFTSFQNLQRRKTKVLKPPSPPASVTTAQDALKDTFMSALRMLRNREKRPDDKMARGLFEIVDSIISHGNSDISPETAAFCEQWVQEAIRQYLQNEGMVPNINTLSKKLEFALSVAALDQRLHAMIGNWPSVSELMGLPSDFGIDQQIPGELLGILPLPPLGQTYGFICPEANTTQKESQTSVTQRILNTYEYAAIGRYFVLNFHRLLADLDGLRGPNVIAFSGTSWLPGSTKWDFGVEPAAVLEPPKSNQQAIQQSLFTFWPQYEDDKKTGKSEALNVSGEETMRLNLQKLTKSLIGKPNIDRSPLSIELGELQRLGKEDPKLWGDRQRILLIVNSYDQVKEVANTIAKYGSKDVRSSVIGLVRNADSLSENGYFDLFVPLARGDVESIRDADAKVVVAPMSAIGRGYNILNAEGYAAFGSVFFLIRPMPQPFNMQEIVIEMNKNLLDFIKNPWDKKGALHLKKASPSLYDEMMALHTISARSWANAETRLGYQSLGDLQRSQLANNTIGMVIQTCGRLLRGGVPFRTHFVDAKWAPNSALPNDELTDTPDISLLSAMQVELARLCKHPIGQILYGPIAEAMKNTIGLRNEYSKATAPEYS